MKLSFLYREERGVDPTPIEPHEPILRPKIPVRVIGPTGLEAVTWGLLDTGADETILPRDFADSLGIELWEERAVVYGADDRPISIRYGEVELELTCEDVTYRWSTAVAFQRGRRYTVLGRAGFLSDLIVRFDGPSRSILIWTPDELRPDGIEDAEGRMES